MSNIQQYSAPSDLGLTPSDRGTNAAMTAARTVGGFYSQAAEAINDTGRRVASTIADAGDVAVKSIEHQEISKGAAAAAQVFSGLDQAWNNTLAKTDPNDATAAQKFKEDVLEPTLEQLRTGFLTEGGQRYAEGQVEKIRDHFFIKTSADMSRMAGEAVKQNILTTTNSLSNAVIQDPTSLSTSLDLLRHSVNAKVESSPTLSGMDRVNISTAILQDAERTLVRAAAVGAIARNPDAGLKEFSSPKWSPYLSATDLKGLEQQQRAVIRAEHADQSYQRTQQDKQKQDASDQREGEYLQRLHSDSDDDRSSVTAKSIASDFTLTREARERMISMVNRETKPEADARVSARTSVDIMRMMRDPNVDQERVRTAILEARTKDPGSEGSLTKADMADLQKQLEDLKTPQGVALAADRSEFFKQYGPTIDTGMKQGNPTPLGAQGIYRAEKDARRQEQWMRSKDMDPHLLYDPSSEYFLGKPERIGKFRPSLADETAFNSQLKKDRERPAQRDDVMPAVPPEGQRPAGTIYDTPKGKLRWTGTGWVKP